MIKNIVTLVTGGASGLGRGTTERFVKHGSKVIIGDLPSSNGAAVAKELGNNAVFAPLDVTSQKNMQEVLKLIKEKFGRLDVLVNAAGIAIADEYAVLVQHIVENSMINGETIRIDGAVRLNIHS